MTGTPFHVGAREARPAWPCLLLLLVGLLGGCRTAKIASVRESLAVATARPMEPGRAYIAVLPFEDARPNEVHQSGLNAIPVLGLFTQGYGDIHERPEATTSEVWFGHFSQGSLASDIPNALANLLAASGTAREATFIEGGEDSGVDLRRYDYVVSGMLKSSRLEDEFWDYGLNAFTIVDASFIPHVLGLPHARRSVSVTFDVALHEQATHRLLWKATVTTPRRAAIEGLYYGTEVAGTNPYAGLIAESVKGALPQVDAKVREALAAP